MDLNLDRKKSKEELKYAYCQAGIDIDKEQLEKIIDSVDFDTNGYIEYEEFIRVTIPTNHLFKEENLKIAFAMFDLDKNGTISLSEVKEVLGMGKSIDESVMKEIMSEINNQGDDEITYEQFKNIITSL